MPAEEWGTERVRAALSVARGRVSAPRRRRVGGARRVLPPATPHASSTSAAATAASPSLRAGAAHKTVERGRGPRRLAADAGEGAAERFAGRCAGPTVVEHDLAEPLPPQGPFDVVVSELRHPPPRRRAQAVAVRRGRRARRHPDGLFANLEVVPSPTEGLHRSVHRRRSARRPEEADPSDRTLDVFTQVGWLRALGFEDADCHWKWREMALLAGVKPE